MKEVFGDAWELMKNYDVLCITTNGMVKKNGECVMGRGIAAQFKARYPFGPKILGDKIKANGNIVQPIIWNDEITFMAFPTKHHWTQQSDPELIYFSACALAQKARAMPDKLFLLPRPGCSNGGLNWQDVKPLIDFLPDNIHVISYSNS